MSLFGLYDFAQSICGREQVVLKKPEYREDQSKWRAVKEEEDS